MVSLSTRLELANLDSLISDLDHEQQAALLDHAYILHVAVEEEGVGDAGVGVELLDGAVVKTGSARANTTSSRFGLLSPMLIPCRLTHPAKVNARNCHR